MLHVLPPGPAYDLSFSEVRSHSLVLLWKAPVYTGASPVTGYLVDMAKKGSSEFVTLNQEAVSHHYLQVRRRTEMIPELNMKTGTWRDGDGIRKLDFRFLTTWRWSHCFLQVTGLEEGESYVFRVRAVSAVGIGQPSQVSEPVCARVLPGNQFLGSQSPGNHTTNVFVSITLIGSSFPI